MWEYLTGVSPEGILSGSVDSELPKYDSVRFTTVLRTEQIGAVHSSVEFERESTDKPTALAVVADRGLSVEFPERPLTLEDLSAQLE